MKLLDQGAFGKAWKATANGLRNKPGPTIVAVKEAKDSGAAEDNISFEVLD